MIATRLLSFFAQLTYPCRQNLDPFDQYDDATLNSALQAAGFTELQKDIVKGKLTLDSTISGGGQNLSVGQRQILALARAIVRRSKLLILDEGEIEIAEGLLNFRILRYFPFP